jgi:hypothetical protein
MSWQFKESSQKVQSSTADWSRVSVASPQPSSQRLCGYWLA